MRHARGMLSWSSLDSRFRARVERDRDPSAVTGLRTTGVCLHTHNATYYLSEHGTKFSTAVYTQLCVLECARVAVSTHLDQHQNKYLLYV